MVYENCRFYGPYSNSKDGRLRCILVHPNGYKQTVSYPKYLMEVHLGRYLEENETIDHIDGNFLNNDFLNLRVINRKQHAYEDSYKNENVIVNCSYCGKEFEINGRFLHNRNRRDRYLSGYFCSKKCSGKYGKEIQLGLRKHITVDKVIPNRYKVKSAQIEKSEVEAG